MLRKLLLLLALLVLVAIALVYMGIIHWPGGSTVELRPVEVQMETRQVNVQVPVVSPSGGTENMAQPAPAPATAPAVPPAPAPAPQQ